MQRLAEATSHHDQLLDIKTLEIMLQNKAKGLSVGESTGIKDSKTLNEFNGVLERAIVSW